MEVWNDLLIFGVIANNNGAVDIPESNPCAQWRDIPWPTLPPQRAHITLFWNLLLHLIRITIILV